jgi:predicted DNA-binding transcriptional regulator YafY
MSLPAKAAELDEIIDALLRCEPVTMKYQDFDGQVSRPRVQPLSLVLYTQQLYLFGRYPAGDVRPLRLSRISNVRRISRPFEYPSKTEYDPEQVCRDSFGIFIGGGAPADVAVRLDGRWAVHAATHRWHPSQTIEPRGDHVVVKLRVRICPELEAWVLSFGGDAEVLSPSSLRDRIAAKLRAAFARYAD